MGIGQLCWKPLTQRLRTERIAVACETAVRLCRSLTVHYRQVAPESWAYVRDTLKAIVQEHEPFRLTSGAMVWEVRPSVLAKGTAALWLNDQQAGPNALTIFIGDDVTDEDAFQAFPDGITVVVGPSRPSAARHTVTDHEEVHDFFDRIASLVAE